MEIVQAQPSQVFQAAWPEGHAPTFPPNTDVVASIALVIFTAYYSTGLAIFCGITVAAFWAIRKVAAWVIHMSAGPLAPESQQNLESQRGALKSEHTQIQMKTPDGFTLDGLLHEGSAKKAMIFCGGNAQIYEETAEWIFSSLAHLEDLSILCFNPRGTQLSEGTSSPDMLQYDSFTAFEYLVSQGYQPEDICILGVSLGGAYGTLGAALAQAKYPKAQIGAINLNSFANLPLEVEHLFRNVLQNETLAKIVSIFIRIFGWEMDAAAAWETLRNPNKTLFCHAQDGIIPFEASIHEATFSGNKICDGDHGGERAPKYHFPSIERIAAPLRTILRLDPSQYSGDTLP